MLKAEALRQAQLALLHGNEGVLESNRCKGTPMAMIEGTNKAELSQPIFKLNLNPRYSHPYYWAPFILIGNWQ